MTYDELLQQMALAERLKCSPRHAWTSTGRRESVAEHCWRLALLSFYTASAFPGVDLTKLLLMSLFHDIGEAFTGDIPTFEKTAAHEATEAQAVEAWLHALPADVGPQLTALLAEYEAQETQEARLVKALDKMEALIQHNESPIETWLPLEYQLNFVYGQAQTDGDPYLNGLRAAINAVTREKIAREAPAEAPRS